MSKEAQTNDNVIHPLLKDRWSPRAFEDRPVEKEKLMNILEAARWSPSASNIQPWVFFLGLKGDETYEKIFRTMVEFNRLWARFAPVLILNCGRLTNDEGVSNGTWQYDTGQSVAHLSLQAMAEGLYVHQMSGFDALKAAELFDLPEDVRAISLTALGYLGDPSMLHPRMQKSERAPRVRKELNTFVFAGKFGETSGIIT
jgi:nitroreductase